MHQMHQLSSQFPDQLIWTGTGSGHNHYSDDSASVQGASELAFSAKWTTKDYIRAENKLQSLSKLLSTQVVKHKQQYFFSKVISPLTHKTIQSTHIIFLQNHKISTAQLKDLCTYNLLEHTSYSVEIPISFRKSKRYTVERTNKAEMRLEEQSEKAESSRMNWWNEIVNRAIKTETDTRTE